MAKRYYGSYESKENRSAIEASDGAMVGNGSGNFANMPKETVMREYPKLNSIMPENMNDGIGGVDKQIRQDQGRAKSNLQKDGA